MEKKDLINLIEKLDNRVFKMKANAAVVQAHRDLLQRQLEEYKAKTGK